MTNSIQLAGTLLAANEDNTLSYLLLPYGEEGRTSVGRVTASKGTLTLPDGIVANLEHDRTRPLARSVSIAETDQGLTATFKVLDTSAGRDLLVEAREGVRTGISVEIDEPVIRNGALLSGSLSGAGFVTQPAFPSAQLVAADHGDLTDPSDSAAETAERPSPAEPEDEPQQPENDVLEEVEDADNKETEDMESTNAAVPADLMVASRNGASSKPATGTVHEVAKLIAGFHASGRTDNTLLAALNDVTQTNVYDAITTPQYLGQLWKGRTYQTRYADLIQHGDLTAMTMVGWRFKTGFTPVVADYAGNKAAIASNNVQTEAVSFVAARIAAGWDIDRIMVDFPNPEFWAAFFQAATDDYALKLDNKVIAYLTANATAVTGGTVPTGVTVAASKIADGAIALLTQQNVVPTFALVSASLWRDFLLTREQDSLKYLASSLGLEEGTLNGFTIRPSAELTAGKVLVGAKQAATLYELPGSPIRVDALDLARGGVDAALFGYYALNGAGKGLVTV